MDEPKIFNEDNFLSVKGIIAEMLLEVGLTVEVAHAINTKLADYMKHNDVIISLDEGKKELCFGRLKEE